jgi:hypothetical protein
MIDQNPRAIGHRCGSPRRHRLRDIAVPVIGTGRGRIDPPRKKIVDHIAQSFADASSAKRFSNKLIIVISPEDAEKYDVNLSELRDFLTPSLHF